MNNLFTNLLTENPQLFREIKGKIKTRNIAIAVLVSLITQGLIFFYFYSQILVNPGQFPPYSSYCINKDASNTYFQYDYVNQCVLDSLGHLTINWQRWWLDIFISLSVISIIFLIVIGTFLLITDLTKEEQRGTLNLLRLSPQTATSIGIGKILGVPSLLYLGVLGVFPLHLFTGLKAQIPISLILGFDLVIIFSCAFFYSAAILIGVIKIGIEGFKSWLTSGTTFLFLSLMTSIIFNSYSIPHHDANDWLTLFYPGIILRYLVEATSLENYKYIYSTSQPIKDLFFYGQSLSVTAFITVGFVLFNYSLWTYWLWQGWQRRFHNSSCTILSKQQSYWLTVSFVAIVLGFTLQTTNTQELSSNFIGLQVYQWILFLGLIAALSPHRQTLSDWARYRHQNQSINRNLFKELIIGENSPATVAIALNVLIAIAYIVPSLLIFSVGKASIFWSLLLTGNIIIICAFVAQSILLMKGRKQALWATGIVLSLIILPLVGLSILEVQSSSFLWLFTLNSIAATQYVTTTTLCLFCLGQWLAIALVGFRLNKQLRQAGASETKILLEGKNSH